MLRIRLRRTGKKKQPSYRVVVADKDAPRDGDFVEVVGHYNPRTNPRTLVFDEERVKHWLSVGAQPSETVHRMLYAEGLWSVEPPKRPTTASRAEREAAERARAEAEARAQAEAEAQAAAASAESSSEAAAEEPAPSE